MVFGSVGKCASRSFRIDSVEENERSPTLEQGAPKRNPFSRDPLAQLFNHHSEAAPLLLDGTEKASREEELEAKLGTDKQLEAVNICGEELRDDGRDDVRHHLVVDVFVVNQVDKTWKQASRFARYEQDCEGFDNHFGKPHVPFVTMAAHNALLQMAPKSILLPDVMYEGIDDFCKILENHVIDPEVPMLGKKLVGLIRSRVFTLEKPKTLGACHSSSTQSLHTPPTSVNDVSPRDGFPRSMISAPYNLGSLALGHQKRMPTVLSGLLLKSSILGAQSMSTHPLEPKSWDESNEVSMLVTGVISDITVCRLVAIRFSELTEIQEVFPNMNKIRHVYFLVGPQLQGIQYVEMGRALATIMSNPHFTDIFGRLKSSESISRAIERFLAETVVIPPGRIDNKNLVAGDLIRKFVNMQAEKHAHNNNTPQHIYPTQTDIERNVPPGKEKERESSKCFIFQGAIEDVKRRFSGYGSDFGDFLNLQVFTVIIYMFCVTVVPTLTFGAILSIGTNGILAVTECLLGQAFCGFIWSFLSCQPLLVVSPTGPFLVFEKALHQFTSSHELDFLEVRFYTGCFLVLLTVFGSAFNVAGLIKYVTIYTEDIFCALISMIFFYEVIEFLELQYHHNRIEDLAYYTNKTMNCTGIPEEECHLSNPNSFLLQLIMVLASIAVFHYLRQLSRSTFFGRTFRNLCGNFGGSVAVAVVTIAYHLFFSNVSVSVVHIPQTIMEEARAPGKRGIFVIPRDVPTTMTLLVSLGAALLLFVLLFVETEIPEQMALRESRKLKKGGGLHWDLMIAGFCCFVCSICGLPWQCPAAVQSLAHINALTVYKKSAPGEPSRPDHVIEQRGTGLVVYALLACTTTIGHYLSIPSATIFGVFFYLGVRNLNGNSLLMRIRLFFLPAKYRGSHKFLDIAPFHVISIFTLIQLAILIAMFVAKSTKIGGLLFPIMLVACTLFVAHFLPKLFDKQLLEALDGEDLEEEEEESENDESAVDFYYNTRIPV